MTKGKKTSAQLDREISSELAATKPGKTKAGNLVTCPRCDGRKWMREYGHVAAGVCFLCAGSGKITESSYKRFVKPVPHEPIDHKRICDASMKGIARWLEAGKDLRWSDAGWNEKEGDRNYGGSASALRQIAIWILSDCGEDPRFERIVQRVLDNIPSRLHSVFLGFISDPAGTLEYD